MKLGIPSVKKLTIEFHTFTSVSHIVCPSSCKPVIKLFHAFGIVSVKNVTMPSTILLTVSFIAFQAVVIAFRKPSFVFQRYIIAATSAVIPAIIHVVGDANWAKFNFNCDNVNAFNAAVALDTKLEIVKEALNATKPAVNGTIKPNIVFKVLPNFSQSVVSIFSDNFPNTSLITGNISFANNSLIGFRIVPIKLLKLSCNVDHCPFRVSDCFSID